MQTYISLLRGINVSGKNKIKMADLRTLLSSLNLVNVQTYIQSGNVIFQAPTQEEAHFSTLIHQAIQKAYTYEVPVLTKTVKDWREIAENNPFLAKDPSIDIKTLHVTLLKSFPSKEACENLVNKAMKYAPDACILVGKNVYIHCPNGYGRTKLNNGFFEKALQVQATTRNWRTIGKIMTMC